MHRHFASHSSPVVPTSRTKIQSKRSRRITIDPVIISLLAVIATVASEGSPGLDLFLFSEFNKILETD